MKTGLLLGVVLLLLLANACGGGEPTAEPSAGQPVAQAEPASLVGDAAQGKRLFAASCSACHGPAGEGVQGLGKDMTRSEFIAGLSDAELMEFIRTGRETSDPLNTTGVAMPPMGGNPALTDEQLMHIIAYMRSLQQ